MLVGREARILGRTKIWRTTDLVHELRFLFHSMLLAGCRYFNQPALIVASVCQHLVEKRSARAHECHDDTTKSVASCRARLSNEVLVTVAVVAEEAVSCLSKIGFRERKSYEKWRIVASLN